MKNKIILGVLVFVAACSSLYVNQDRLKNLLGFTSTQNIQTPSVVESTTNNNHFVSVKENKEGDLKKEDVFSKTHSYMIDGAWDATTCELGCIYLSPDVKEGDYDLKNDSYIRLSGEVEYKRDGFKNIRKFITIECSRFDVNDKYKCGTSELLMNNEKYDLSRHDLDVVSSDKNSLVLSTHSVQESLEYKYVINRITREVDIYCAGCVTTLDGDKIESNKRNDGFNDYYSKIGEIHIQDRLKRLHFFLDDTLRINSTKE